MLINHYISSKNKTLNNNDEQCTTCDKCVKKYFKNIEYTTTSLTIFDNFTPTQINILLEEQEKVVIKEADTQLKYNLISSGSYKKTLEQYKYLFYYQKHFYLKEEIKNYLTQQLSLDSTYTHKTSILQQTKDKLTTNITQNQPETTTTEPPIQQTRKHIGISRLAIRNITGYTYQPIPKWSTTGEPVTIEWQKDLLEDNHELIVINGSRQMGKSYTIGEKAVEESFKANNDMLVGGFQTTTTNVIRDYIIRYIRKFPEGDFVHFKSERYIQNMKTLTKIYFRTLADDAQNILGMTLHLIIVDEAQLINDYVFKEVLLPTLSTTGGRLIMIGTPGRKRKGYYFDTMMSIKRGLIAKEDAKLYEVDITKNPLTHPKKRAEIMANRFDPAIRRQWFCEWNDGGEKIFDIPTEQEYPTLSNNGFFVLGKDPARLGDGSGYSLLYMINGKIYIILSGRVPDSFKSKWELQAKFYKDLLEKFKTFKEKFHHTMDITGVGDGVYTIWTNDGIPCNATIRYTDGQSEVLQGLHWRVSKSAMVNTFLDIISEGKIVLLEQGNKDLIEELSYAQDDSITGGKAGFTSTFTDDIINATMIAVYYAEKRRLISRSNTYADDQFVSSGVPLIDAIENNIQSAQSDIW